jgi:hypothetical protein
MRLGITFLCCLTLTGCETPTSVQRVSDYEICRLSILRPPLQSAAAINEADRQIRLRGVNCGSYASTIFQQQQQGLNQLQQGLANQQKRNEPLSRPIQTTCTRNGQIVNCTSN